LTRVVREDRATGAGSGSLPASSDGCGVINGCRVERASGRRRVRNSVEACRYVRDTWVLDCRADEREDDNDDREAEILCVGEKPVSAVVGSVAVGLMTAV
jgi:hypothetical protein